MGSFLGWAVVFFILAIGFGGIAAGSATIAKVLFFFFVVALIASVILGLVRGRRPA